MVHGWIEGEGMGRERASERGKEKESELGWGGGTEMGDG